MSAEVPDTSVFIRAIRTGGEDILDRAVPGRLFLCAVVAHELWAGTRSRDDGAALGRLLSGLERLNPVLTPGYQDWTLAGRLLQRYQQLFGALRPADHSHDVLIVLCASQVAGTVLTTNARHLERWALLARRAGRRVRVAAVRS